MPDPWIVLGRLTRFFYTLLNARSDKPRLDNIEDPLQWPFMHALGVEPTENELITAPKSMAKRVKVLGGLDEFSVELLKLGLKP